MDGVERDLHELAKGIAQLVQIAAGATVLAGVVYLGAHVVAAASAWIQRRRSGDWP